MNRDPTGWDDEIEESEVIYSNGALADQAEAFLRSFKENDKYKYVEMINTMMVREEEFITVNYQDLPQKIGGELWIHPDETLEALVTAGQCLLRDFQYDYAKEIEGKFQVRITNNYFKIGIREINTEVINKFVTVPGLVVRSTEVKPLGTGIAFSCIECNAITSAKLKGVTMISPKKCSNCNSKELMLNAEDSKYIDFQIVRIQELPDELPAGQLPHYIEVIVKGNLVDKSRPGDRVLLTGIVRIEQDPKANNIFNLRIEANNFEYLGGLDPKGENLAISEEDERKIRELAAKPNAYNNLIQSFAPHIYGHDEIKESILLLTVGSVARKNSSSRRGDINIFIVGDPGLAKSELLKFAARIAPRGLYTAGRGNSAAGMTAAVIHDKNNMLVLEAGAVVLGDQGTVCIDEFDKIQDHDRSALHEVMEQQTCSVAKGGIVATLNARCSILAAANPNGQKYDLSKSVAENVAPIPVPLLTRFDIIHILIDKVDEEKDSKITSHILRDMESSISSVIDLDLLKKYLVFTKKIEPKLSKDATYLLGEYYKKMRALHTSGIITVTPRQLEGLVRIATARARLLLKEYVELEDAQRAINLVTQSLANIGIDIQAGTVELPEKKKTNKTAVFMDILNSYPQKLIEEKELIKDLVKSGFFDEYEAKEYIQKAYTIGKIYEPKSGFYSKV